LNRKAYDVIVVSPRNHFLFTPLLTSTTVGTLEYRAITEPVRYLKDLQYHQSKCVDIDTTKNSITVKDVFNENNIYSLSYDVLIYACGAQANDFGIKGVREHALFLKQVRHAMLIRDKIEELFERASKPTTTRAQKEKLLSIVIVGGGPTSIEFAAELYDWLTEDGARMFPELMDIVSVYLIEATSRILTGFDRKLAEYTMKTFRKRKIHLLLDSKVIGVTDDYVELADGYKLQYGMVVWATGNMPVRLTESISWKKTKHGRIIIDEHCRVPPLTNVFAIGDCAEYIKKPLPPTAQAAKQQGFYLAVMLNSFATHPFNDFEKNLTNYPYNFAYSHRGAMAYIGGWKGVISMDGEDKEEEHPSIVHRVEKVFPRLTGWKAWLLWRSAYFTMLRSLPNQLLVPMYWFKAWVFGRDFSRF